MGGYLGLRERHVMAGSSTGFPLSSSISSPRSDDGLGLSVTGLVVSLDQIGSDRGFLGWKSYTGSQPLTRALGLWSSKWVFALFI
jgi:hypothetical protein